MPTGTDIRAVPCSETDTLRVAVSCLLWVSRFQPLRAPPPAQMPGGSEDHEGDGAEVRSLGTDTSRSLCTTGPNGRSDTQDVLSQLEEISVTSQAARHLSGSELGPPASSLGSKTKYEVPHFLRVTLRAVVS